MACPDMFLCIVFQCVIRQLDGRVEEIGTMARLGTGFTCYVFFCVVSTASSLALQIPRLSTSVSEREVQPMTSRISCWLSSAFGELGLCFSAVLMALASLILVCLGMNQPCLALAVREDLLVEPRGPLPQAAMPVIEALDIPARMKAHVSLLGCACSLWKASADGEFNSFVAFILLVFFAFLLTALDLVALIVAAVSILPCAYHIS